MTATCTCTIDNAGTRYEQSTLDRGCAAVLISWARVSALSSSGRTLMRVLIFSENTRVQRARASASSWLCSSWVAELQRA